MIVEVPSANSRNEQAEQKTTHVSGNPTLAFPAVEIKTTLLTGGFDPAYAFGLAMALIAKGVSLEMIGSDDVDRSELHSTPKLNFLNLQGDKGQHGGRVRKISAMLAYYARLFRYSCSAKPKVFHVLWNAKFEMFDRTLLMLFYKLLGKKIVLTAHNVNAAKRDGVDTWLNRATLKVQYRCADHIFVHTEKMKLELFREFGVREQAVTVIPFGINNSVPDTDLTPEQAKQRLGIGEGEKTLLFFGNIGPYKGLEFLVEAFQKIAAKNPQYRLIIAGKARGGCQQYLEEIQSVISRDPSRDRVLQKIEYIPDEDTELYLKAADVLVLPYRHIFQSGVLILGYTFGLPVVAADVGSLRDDIIEGSTGFLCKPCDAMDLAAALEKYFASGLFQELSARRQEIRGYAKARHSWDLVGEMTRKVYAELVTEHPGKA